MRCPAQATTLSLNALRRQRQEASNDGWCGKLRQASAILSNPQMSGACGRETLYYRSPVCRERALEDTRAPRVPDSSGSQEYQETNGRFSRALMFEKWLRLNRPWRCQSLQFSCTASAVVNECDSSLYQALCEEGQSVGHSPAHLGSL